MPLLNRLDPTVDRLNDELLPFLAERDDSTRLRNYEAIGPFFSALDTVATPLNSAGHLLQFAVLLGANSVISLNTPVARSLEPAMRVCETQLPARAARRCTAAGQVLSTMFGGSK